MSDQFTRITCGGSPLPVDAPVVGLLFGSTDDQKVLQVRDADDIPTEISDATKVQVDLHKAVFPQHSVVGWYRVSGSDEEPTPSDLQITQSLKQHYASSSAAFCFCLLQVSKDEKPSPAGQSTIQDELPVGLYSLFSVDGKPVLLGWSSWQLETSEPERIAVERVMKEPAPDAPRTNAYTGQMKSMQHSILTMKERIQLLVEFLEKMQQGDIPPNYSLLRQVQGLLYSIGALCSRLKSEKSSNDPKLISHLAVVAKTVEAVESYTDKFRLVHESKTASKEMRRAF
jgi:COP9 signalosome complex subunit 6